MKCRIVFILLAIQATVLFLLVAGDIFNVSPISWSDQGEYQICAVGHGSFADDAENINSRLNEIIEGYYANSADNHNVRFNVLRSDCKLTILELTISKANVETGQYNLLKEQIWVDTSQRGRAVLFQMGDPTEFLSYSQSLRPSRPF